MPAKTEQPPTHISKDLGYVLMVLLNLLGMASSARRQPEKYTHQAYLGDKTLTHSRPAVWWWT